jgi:hypothetical protein
MMKIKGLILLVAVMLMTASFLSHADGVIADSETGCKIWNSKLLVGYTVTWTGQCKNCKADGAESLQRF